MKMLNGMSSKHIPAVSEPGTAGLLLHRENDNDNHVARRLVATSDRSTCHFYDVHDLACLGPWTVDWTKLA